MKASVARLLDQHRLRRLLLGVALALAFSGVAVAAHEPRHSAFGIEGLKTRARVPFAGLADRVLFQEIVPCRLVDTREEQAFDLDHGSPPLVGGETRRYAVSGPLPAENGCNLARRLSPRMSRSFASHRVFCRGRELR
jgi:hypothetical protein